MKRPRLYIYNFPTDTDTTYLIEYPDGHCEFCNRWTGLWVNSAWSSGDLTSTLGLATFTFVEEL